MTGPGLSDEMAVPSPEPGEVSVGDKVSDLVLQPRLIVSGLDSPVDVVGDPASDRLFVVEKKGRIRIIDDRSIQDEPFLDITQWVGSVGNEQGLLSLRFHPDFASNGRVFAFFTDKAGTSHLIEARVDPRNEDKVDPATIRRMLTLPQYGQYHQSGSMFFGPDGYLWVSLGDGGGIGDPEKRGQDPTTLEASIIRIDVDYGSPYAIPVDNPFVENGLGRGEVWAYGLRNPWRISFDSQTGLIYIPDVGQEGSEEINVVPLNAGGHNFGWSVSEGTDCYGAETCDFTGQTMPVYQYLHNGNGCAMIGGQVYRGDLMEELNGHYFLSDFCLGWIRSVVLDDNEVYSVHDWTKSTEDRLGNVTSIGADRNGELYVSTLEGEIWRLELGQ